MAQPIIKRDVADELFAAGAKGFNFQSVEHAARNIIAEAQAEAAELLRRAKLEVDRMRDEIRGEEFEAARKDGFDKGYEEGFSQGLEKGAAGAHEARLKQLNEQVGDIPAVLGSMVHEIEARRAKLVDDSEKDLMALAFSIAERFTRSKIETSSDTVKETVRECIELVLNRASMDIFLAPQDLRAVEQFLPALRKEFTDAGTIQIHADPELSRGSVIIRTGRGEVSSSLSDQIDSISLTLLGVSPKEALSRVGVDIDSPPPVPHPGEAKPRKRTPKAGTANVDLS